MQQVQTQLQNLPNTVLKFIQDEVKSTNFNDDQGNFDFNKIKEYFYKDLRRACIFLFF